MLIDKVWHNGKIGKYDQLTLIDIHKAYDSVDHELLIEKLKELQKRNIISDEILRGIKFLLNIYKVDVLDKEVDPISVKRGLP